MTDEIQPREITSIVDVEDHVVAAARSARITDANETMVLARQLEIVKAAVLQKKYQGLIGRSLVPASPDGDNASEFVVVRTYDEYTLAKVVTNYATDFPLVSSAMSESFAKYFSVGNAFAYSIQDLRQAAKSGVNVPARQAETARRGVEQTIDDIIFRGVPGNGTYGLMNQPNVPLVNLATGNWASASGELILADLHALAQSVVDATATVFAPDTIVMDSVSYGILTGKYVGLQMENVLAKFLRDSPYIRNVVSSTKLNTLDSAGTGPRMICYLRDPEVLQLEMGQEFEMFPGEARAMTVVTACHARLAGVSCYHPMAMAYVENHR
jgi:hypothetical protein